MCSRWLNYIFMENRTETFSPTDGGSFFSGRGENYSILCFIISTLIVFLLSLSLALAALRCYDYCKSRSSQVNSQSLTTKAVQRIERQNSVFEGSSVPVLLSTFLRDCGQDRPDGAAKLPAGLQASPSL